MRDAVRGGFTIAISFLVDSDEDHAFRKEVQVWLATNLTDELRGWATRPPFELSMQWYRKLAVGGYIAPHWPKKYGGAELSLTRQLILREELALAGAPEITGQGLNHIGPLLIEFGTEEQKARHLPPILSGEITWCQGYSEPNAGSDLASLRTSAVIDGDEFVINGQKIWTTWAHYAQWMFALVRTDPDAPRKQAGISFVLIDMKTPGLTVRPIATIADDDELAEVFFDDVRIPRENLVGELNDGWRVANALLVNERLGSGNAQYVFTTLDRAAAVARVTGAADDPKFRDRLAKIELDAVALNAFFSHAVALTLAGKSPGPSSSIMKIVGSESFQAAADLMFEAAGGLAARNGRIDTAAGSIDVSSTLRQVRRASIYGGANEIQRNILSRRVLDLPNG